VILKTASNTLTAFSFPDVFPFTMVDQPLPITHRLGCFHIFREEKKAIDWNVVRGIPLVLISVCLQLEWYRDWCEL